VLWLFDSGKQVELLMTGMEQVTDRTSPMAPNKAEDVNTPSASCLAPAPFGIAVATCAYSSEAVR
jgi:hypothetical protein